LNTLDEDIIVFHAGTKMIDGKLLTNGGRVLNVVACGDDLTEIKNHLYKNIDQITFQNMFYRKDIGYRALQLL
jgi:phosphoribosylamine--glycine ligase